MLNYLQAQVSLVEIVKNFQDMILLDVILKVDIILNLVEELSLIIKVRLLA